MFHQQMKLNFHKKHPRYYFFLQQKLIFFQEESIPTPTEETREESPAESGMKLLNQTAQMRKGPTLTPPRPDDRYPYIFSYMNPIFQQLQTLILNLSQTFLPQKILTMSPSCQMKMSKNPKYKKLVKLRNKLQKKMKLFPLM